MICMDHFSREEKTLNAELIVVRLKKVTRTVFNIKISGLKFGYPSATFVREYYGQKVPIRMYNHA